MNAPWCVRNCAVRIDACSDVGTSANYTTCFSYAYQAMNVMPGLGIGIIIANSCRRWRGIFKRLSQDGGRTDFSENLRALLFNDDDQSNEPILRQIHLTGQYIWKIF